MRLSPARTVAARARVLPVAAVLTILELLALAAWQRHGYWDFSDGVYSLSARQWLHGLVPYRDFAAAQPPPVFLVGTLLLWLRDSADTIRAGMAACQLASALLCAVAVLRLSGSRAGAIGAALALPLLPIELHEHAQLVPETLAAPLVLAAALLAARGSQRAAGGVLAVAVFCKFAFLLPALAVVLAARRPRTAAAALFGGLAVAAAACTAGFGTAFWRGTVTAQFSVGAAAWHDAAGLIAQGAWNELGLIVLAGGGWWLSRDCRSGWLGRGPRCRWRPVRDRWRDADPLTRTLVAAALSGLLLIGTAFKRGSYINVLTVAEGPLLVLAVCGARSLIARRPYLAGLATGLVALQSVSVLAQPSNPWFAKRPGARSGLAAYNSPDEIAGRLVRLRRCPRADTVSDPYLALLSGHPTPGDQPDQFMVTLAEPDARFLRAVEHDPRRLCPR